MPSVRQSAALLLPVLLALLCPDTPSRAHELVYATADMGAANYFGGVSITSQQYVGVRFSVANPMTVTAIGGHFFRGAGGNGQIFGAIVQLVDEDDFPLSTDLTGPDLVGGITFTPPAQSADVVEPFGPVTLMPGTFALVYGSGSFGATGTGAMPDNNPPIGSPDLIGYQSFGPGWYDAGTPHVRLTLYVPEPAAGSATLLAAAALALPRRRRVGAGT